MVADNLNGLISEATFMAVLESYGFETCFCQKHFKTWAKVFRRSANQPYGDLSSNPAKVYSFFLNKCCLNRTKMSKKRLRLTQFLTLNRDQNCRACEKYEKTKGRNYLTGAENKKMQFAIECSISCFRSQVVARATIFFVYKIYRSIAVALPKCIR